MACITTSIWSDLVSNSSLLRFPMLLWRYLVIGIGMTWFHPYVQFDVMFLFYWKFRPLLHRMIQLSLSKMPVRWIIFARKMVLMFNVNFWTAAYLLIFNRCCIFWAKRVQTSGWRNHQHHTHSTHRRFWHSPISLWVHQCVAKEGAKWFTSPTPHFISRQNYVLLYRLVQ